MSRLNFLMTYDSNGTPVLVDRDGRSYSPQDKMPWGESAGEFVFRLWLWGEDVDHSDEVTRFISAAGLISAVARGEWTRANAMRNGPDASIRCVRRRPRR